MGEMNANKRQKLHDLIFTINGENDPVKNVFLGEVCFHIKQIYTPITIIGEGNYGSKVCSAQDMEDNEKIVSIKKIPISFEYTKIFETLQIWREMKILTHLNAGEHQHPSIIRLSDIMIPVIAGRKEFEFEEIYLVYGYMDDDLDKVIKRNQLNNVQVIKNYFTQMLKGVDYMHSLSVMHRDLKPKNVLIDHMHHGLQICDFGWSGLVDEKNRNFNVGTKFYRAPELVLECTKHNTAVDIWSLGCIFGEILLGRPIFDNGEDEDELEAIISFLGPPADEDMDFIDNNQKKDLLQQILLAAPNHVPFVERFQDVGDRFPDIDHSVILLVQRMLSFDPSKRITANECLKNDFIGATAEIWDKVYKETFKPPPKEDLLQTVWEDTITDVPTIRSLIWSAMKNVQKENLSVFDNLLQCCSIAFGCHDHNE